MADIQHPNRVGERNQTTNANASQRTAVGCLCKKELFYMLRPNARTYNRLVIYNFFTDELLDRCGLTREQLKKVRVFPIAVNTVVIDHLRQNYLMTE